MKSHYWETRQSMTPEKSLAFLKEGNARFLQNLSLNRNLLQLVNETKEDQFPFVAILSCSDSRISPELVFDQGLGDIFSVRLAGNIASTNGIGSLEFACASLGAKLIVVMGHTNCGAVKGACDNIVFGNMNNLLEHIRFAVARETDTPLAHRHSSNKAFLNNVAKLNVHFNIEEIIEHSTIIREMLERGEIGIVGAMYDVQTGAVQFFDEHLRKPSVALEAVSSDFVFAN